MTLGQAKDKVRENLYDYGITYFSLEDVSDSIQDGYDEIVVYSECYEKWVDLFVGQINARPWVNFKELIPDFYRLLGIYNRQTDMGIDLLADRDEDFYKLDWQNSKTGSVLTGIINGPEWFAAPNWYADSQYKPWRVFYVAQAPKLTSDADVFKIMHEYSKLIELYSTADLLEQNQEYIKASKYWEDYDKILEDYRRKIFLLSKADRIFTRGELSGH